MHAGDHQLQFEDWIADYFLQQPIEQAVVGSASGNDTNSPSNHSCGRGLRC